MADAAELAERILVVQPEPPGELPAGPLAVGVMSWLAPTPQLTVIAKATLSYARTEACEATGALEQARLVEPEPLAGELPSVLPGAELDELYYPPDFVPRKGRPEVLVVGHAHAAAATRRIEGRVTLGALSRLFAVEAAEPAQAIALSTGRLLATGEARADPLGPIARDAGAPHRPDEGGFDDERYNAASPFQRVDAIPLDGVIGLEGLSRFAARREVQLPGLDAYLTVQSPLWGYADVELVCDTLWIDTDAERIVLVWRGTLPSVQDATDVHRLIAALEPRDQPRDWDTRLAYLQRGKIHYAVHEQDLEPGAEPPAMEDTTLQMARYETWGSQAPEPLLPLERYAVISAELAEDPEQRAAVLERHGYEEDSWAVEERAWLEKMARTALDGDARLAADYSDRFMAAQDALATADERERTIEDYAAVVVQLEQTIDLMAVLEGHGLTLPAWLRLDRRWTQAKATDPAVAGELEAKLVELRAQAAGAAPPQGETAASAPGDSSSGGPGADR